MKIILILKMSVTDMFRSYHILLLALLIQGCTGIQHAVKNNPIALPASLTASEGSNSLKITGSLLELISDKAAKDIVREAIKNNYDLKATAKRLEASKFMLSASHADMLPSVDAGYSINRTNQSLDNSTSNIHKIGMSISWELDIWGKLADHKQSAIYSYISESYTYQAAMNSLGARVLQQYINLRAQNRRVEIYQNKLELLMETEQAVERNYMAGLSSISELVDIEAEIHLALADLKEQKLIAEEHVRDLEVLSGRYPSAEFKLSSTAPLDIKKPTEQVPADILKNRPDVLASMKRYEAAIKNSDAAGKARLPNIVISADVYKSNSTFNRLGETRSSWGVMGNILYPVFKAGRLKGAEKASESEAEAVYYEMAKTILQAMKEAEATFSREKMLSSKVNSLVKAVNNAELAHDISIMDYRKGLSDFTSLKSTRRQYLDAQERLLDAQTEQDLNRINIALALGVSVAGDVSND